MTTSSIVTFQDPPAPSRRRANQRDWQAITNELRAHPGKWALVASDSWPATATHIRRGVYAGTTAGELEVRTVNIGGGKVDIYARYIDPA